MKILMVTYAYDTSPIHVFTGSQRAFSFAKYIPRQGVEIVVVSFRNTLRGFRHTGKHGERIYRVLDFFCMVERFLESFKASFCKPNLSIESHRTDVQTGYSTKWHKRIFYMPDRQLYWAVTAFWVARQLHKTEHFDAVLTTSPPESVHLVGWLLKKWQRIPWIADMRDGWMFEPYLAIRQVKGLQQRIESAMERLLISRADSVTTVTRPLLDDIIKRLCVPRDKTFLIPNGFDTDEWKITDKSADKARAYLKVTNNEILIVHVGRLSAASIDRHAAPFFQALKNLKTLNPALSRELVVWMVGITQGLEVNLVRSLGLDDVVHFHPLVPKEEAIAMMKAADVLVLITSVSQKSVATSKLFDYMAAGKPVLALAQGNAAAEIVMQTGIGLAVSPTDISEIVKAIQQVLLWCKQGEFPFKRKSNYINVYNRKNQAAKMADVLRMVC